MRREQNMNIFGGFFIFTGVAILLMGCIRFWAEVFKVNNVWRLVGFCIALFSVIIGVIGALVGAFIGGAGGAATRGGAESGFVHFFGAVVVGGLSVGVITTVWTFLILAAVGGAVIWLIFPIVNWQPAKNPLFVKLIGCVLAYAGYLIAGSVSYTHLTLPTILLV